MKTDPQVMAAVLRKAANNVENGVDWCVGIESQRANGDWGEVRHSDGDAWWSTIHLSGFRYRLAPETITLANGVTIPKPLSKDELNEEDLLFTVNDSLVYIPVDNKNKYVKCSAGHCLDFEISITYKTKEEAIEASKALFE